MTIFANAKTPFVLACVLGATMIGGGKSIADQVIPDDLIVQGSLCVGFDCVNNMNFGSDTIVLRENQLRIFFQDTSIGSFPTNDWRLLANGSDTANFFAIQDDAGGNFRQVFRVDSGAPSNALRIEQFGRVGLGTGTPVLKLHMTSGDTPGNRLEQTGNSGFTPQTWDIAGNEVNFFVRDVTGGSRLPFRIRPGAPTSSIDIAASGNVGVGTANPAAALQVNGAAAALRITRTSGNTGDWQIGPGNAVDNLTFTNFVANADLVTFAGNGNVGIGTTTPAARLHTVGTVRFAGITGCSGGLQTDGAGNVSCLVSSRQFKTLGGELSPQVAVRNVMALRPQTGSYKETPDVPEHWLVAEDVAAVDPALAGFNDGKPYTVKTQNIVADLVAVVQQQQRRIDELERRLSSR